MENQSQSINCHMGSHNVVCHLTQVNESHLNPSQTGGYSIYRFPSDERLCWPWCWLYTEMVYMTAVTCSSSNHMLTTQHVKPQSFDNKTNALTVMPVTKPLNIISDRFSSPLIKIKIGWYHMKNVQMAISYQLKCTFWANLKIKKFWFLADSVPPCFGPK